MLFTFCILIIGLSGIAAQVILLRELLVSFYGNELTVGIVLANWLVCEAAGVYLAGRFIERVREKLAVLVCLQLLFVSFLPFCLFFARVYKDTLGIPTGEGIGLPLIFLASFLIVLPVSFTHGALFSTACRLYPRLLGARAEEAIGKVYAWETTGTILGGAILTYVFLPFLSSVQSFYLLILLNLFICLLLIYKSQLKIARYGVVFFMAAAVILSVSGTFARLDAWSIGKQFKQGTVLGYRNSVYGNVAVTQQAGQFTFFSNGLPVITVPVPDITFVEDFGHLPMAFHPHPKNILVAGAGAGGLLHEILKHPVSSVDYLEIDPLIISMVRQFSTPLTESELNDPRVNVRNLDARYFLRTTDSRYDVIFIGVSNPSDLATNRLFTREFFGLARGHLNPGGILALWLPGSLSYISGELRALNASVLRGLRDELGFLRVIPGDYNIYLASTSSALTELKPGGLAERLRQRGVETALLSESYIAYRLSPLYQQWFKENIPLDASRANRDLRPEALLQMLLLWNKQFSPRIFPILSYVTRLNLTAFAIGILLVTLLIFLVARTGKRDLTALSYTIGTSGFFGMMASLVLVFGFQVYYGYLYHRIGLLISIFMAGSAAGSMYMTHILNREKAGVKLLLYCESAMVFFCLLLAVIMPLMTAVSHFAGEIFAVLFFACGLCIGLEFPLAAKLYLSRKGRVGEAAGALYFADLAGGWFAGILGGIACFASLGVVGTCLVMALLKAGSLLILKSSQNSLS